MTHNNCQQEDNKMKYYSEKTKKIYDSEEELRLDEEKVCEAEKRESAMKKERADAAKIVEEKYENKLKADKEYLDSLNDFCKRFGTYHTTYTSKNIPSSNADILSNLLGFVSDFIYK